MILAKELKRVQEILKPDTFDEMLKENEYELWIEISDEVDLHIFSEKVKDFILKTRTINKEFEIYIAQENLNKSRKFKFIP